MSKIIPLHHGTQTRNLRLELDVPHATFVLVDDDGGECRYETTSFIAGSFLSRALTELVHAYPPPPLPGKLPTCDLCGGVCCDGTYTQWKLGGGGEGGSACVHDACMVALLASRRRERQTGQRELFAMGGGK